MASNRELLEAILNRETVFETPYIIIPGIGTGSIYATGDAFGTKFTLDVPKEGTIETFIMLDMDDEGIETELWLFRHDFTQTADNSEFAISDEDLVTLEIVIGITNFANAKTNQVGINNDLGLVYKAPEGKFYCQCVTRGAPTIAIGNLPRIALRIRR